MRSLWIFSILIGLLFYNTASGQAIELIKKADILFKTENFYDAKEVYENALKKDSKNIYIYMQLAKCHLLISPRSKSLEYIQKAIDLSKQPTLEMYYILGRAYHVNNEFDKAIEYYRESDPEKNNFENIRKLTRECLSAQKLYSTPQAVEISNLGPTINSEHQEYLPFITADHLQLFFTSTRASHGGAGSNDHNQDEDIYTSTFVDGKWSKSVKVEPLNDHIGHDACVGISEDGQMMFVYKGNNGGDIFMTELSGHTWCKLMPLPINTVGFEGTASLSPDGLTLYYIHSDKIKQDRDIYIATRTLGGKWGNALPIKELNTNYDEDSPFIHPDGKTLYFSSKGHTSIGGYDIFKSTRKEDGTWSAPENVGYPINSTGDDVNFVLSADGQFAFYASDKDGGLGKQDIYSIKMLHKGNFQLELLKGEIRDENGEVVGADIVVTDIATQREISRFKSNSENGKFLISLPCGKNYGIHIEREGFLFHSENAQIDCSKGYIEVTKAIVLKKAHSGAKITLNNIFFDTGKSELKEESNSELMKLVKLLKLNPDIKIEISGFTDNVGDESNNLLLSQRRADHVMEYLVSQGVNKNRIKAKGYGSSQSVSSNKTEDGRKLNRRTEFKVL